MADLHKFSDDLKGGNDPNSAPHTISASKLDRNFALCSPIKQDGSAAPYKVDQTDDGWKLVFPFFPPPASGTYVLGVIDGVIQWIATEAC